MTVKLLIVLYEVPEKPARFKVSAWRRLRRLGGLYPRLSLCVLPDTDEVRRGLRDALEEIRRGGSAVALEAVPLAEEDSSWLISALRELKEREYLEILEECDEFLEEIRENVEKGNVTLEEARELEGALASLAKWFREASSTDWLDAPARLEVARKLEECRRALEEFTSMCLSSLRGGASGEQSK